MEHKEEKKCICRISLNRIYTGHPPQKVRIYNENCSIHSNSVEPKDWKERFDSKFPQLYNGSDIWVRPEIIDFIAYEIHLAQEEENYKMSGYLQIIISKIIDYNCGQHKKLIDLVKALQDSLIKE